MPSDSPPRALVLRTAGTNCDAEMVRAFEAAGARPHLIHLSHLTANPALIDDFDIFGFPGGFSYGDDIASGRILAMRLRTHLYPALRRAILRGCPMIGVCNGFQVLVQLGLLPGPEMGESWPTDAPPAPSLALAANAGGRFIDRWVPVEFDARSPCVWMSGLAGVYSTAAARLPIAHGEGRLVGAQPGWVHALAARGQAPLRYVENPNGSECDAAGICDATGLIFGLMPHPERYDQWTRHPFWTRLPETERQGEPLGLAIFRNGVRAARGGLTPAC